MPRHLPPTKASWFDIWAAGVAANTMYVQQGFTDTGVWLGKSIRAKSFPVLILRSHTHTRNVQGMVG